MQKIVITKIDDDNYLVELDNVIAQPFVKSNKKEMVFYILSAIKKLQVPEELRMFNPIDLANRIAKTKALKELEEKNKPKNKQTKLL